MVQRKDGELRVLIKFLEYTKEGKYAPIEESSLTYARLREETYSADLCEEDIYYSVS